MPPIDDDLKRELGLLYSEGGGAPYAERMMAPTLNILGISCGAVGEAARNVIPDTARATIDLRLVPGNDPDDLLDYVESHIRARGFFIARTEPDIMLRRVQPRIAKVTRRAGYPAARTSMDLPIVREIIAAAEQANGSPLVLNPTLGGSLPLHLFTERLGKPVVIAPIANHDNNQHAANENLRLGALWYGIDLFAALLTLPAEPGRP
jgi:acetylornithine deacetylase/succinyl-diaminopimelate desuccinylase-like protein